ncbi:MAG TPA: hypothetical protein VMI31_07545 [Fimbriimonadaceae bacterium]|nr:hypothetical protein [Fimbriimonadaceae bacterium]
MRFCAIHGPTPDTRSSPTVWVRLCILMALTGIVTAARAQVDARVNQYPVYLLHYPSVREDVKLTAAQFAKEASIERQERQAEMTVRSGYSAGAKPAPLTPKERVDLEGKIERLEATMLNVLSGSQQARLKQIGFQFFGVYSFANPVVIKELGLTLDQRRKLIASANARRMEYSREIQELAGNRHLSGTKPDVNIRKLALAKLAWFQKMDADATKILTPTQSRRWKQMKGKPFPIVTLFVPEPAFVTSVKPGKRR